MVLSSTLGNNVECSVLQSILYLHPHILSNSTLKLFHSDLFSVENASQCGQTDSLKVVECGVVLDDVASNFS